MFYLIMHLKLTSNGVTINGLSVIMSYSIYIVM